MLPSRNHRWQYPLTRSVFSIGRMASRICSTPGAPLAIGKLNPDCVMKKPFLALFLSIALATAFAAEPYADRFVWVFGWGLGKQSDITEISSVLDTAGKNGFNGAVVSFGLDTLCQKSPDFFRRLDEVKQAC